MTFLTIISIFELMSKEFILTTKRNDLLRITAYGIENSEKPCLIFVHGFKGFKDWGFGPYAGKYFGDRGYFILMFNFSHNGVGESLTVFNELDKFADNTFSLEVNELSELISAYLDNYFCRTNNKAIGLIGHSRGGAIALLTAKFRTEVNAVAVWSSVAKLDRYSERQKEKWRRTGVFEVLNKRTNQVMKLNVSLLEDIEKNKDNSLNLEKAVKELNRPLMIAHGDQDLAVPVDEAEMLFNWADKGKTIFHKIPSAGHTFGVSHPFEGSNKNFDDLLIKTENFFNINLS